MADDLRRRNSHLGMCKCRKSTALQTQKQQKCLRKRHRRCSRRRSRRATDAKVRCTTRCIPNESKNRKVHCQERRSPAHPTQTRIVALSSAIPVQEWSHRQAQYQYKNCRIVKRNTSTRTVASPSAIPVRAFPKRSERHTLDGVTTTPRGNGKCKRQRKLEQ